MTGISILRVVEGSEDDKCRATSGICGNIYINPKALVCCKAVKIYNKVEKIHNNLLFVNVYLAVFVDFKGSVNYSVKSFRSFHPKILCEGHNGSGRWPQTHSSSELRSQLI